MSEQVKMTALQYDSDRPTAEHPLKVMDLSLRDGHQSLFATRGRTEDMIPVAEMMDEIGFWAIETWGGATFDVCLRFLHVCAGCFLSSCLISTTASSSSASEHQEDTLFHAPARPKPCRIPQLCR